MSIIKVRMLRRMKEVTRENKMKNEHVIGTIELVTSIITKIKNNILR